MNFLGRRGSFNIDYQGQFEIGRPAISRHVRRAPRWERFPSPALRTQVFPAAPGPFCQLFFAGLRRLGFRAARHAQYKQKQYEMHSSHIARTEKSTAPRGLSPLPQIMPDTNRVTQNFLQGPPRLVFLQRACTHTSYLILWRNKSAGEAMRPGD